jgi:hypothetical protein
MSTMSKIHNLTKIAGQAPKEGSCPEEGEEEEDPRGSRIIIRKTHTSIISIMGGDTTPKGAQKQRKTWQEYSKKKR